MKLDQPLPARPNLDHYLKQAIKFLSAFKSGDPEATRWVRRYHPSLPGRPNTNDRNAVAESDLQRLRLSPDDARFIIARRHQFEDWPKFVKHIHELNLKDSPVAQFETAVDAIVSGDFARLKRLLRQNPELVHARSTREHRATLLHYVAANAVEDYRQKTPKNIVAIAKALLLAGAEVDADLDYGLVRDHYPERIGSTTLGLAATSCHPAAAGVQIPLIDLLLKHGASVNGLRGGWNPLIAALHNGRGPAAAHLAKRGARLDLEGALGVGRLDVVKTFFTKAGRLKRNATKKQMEMGFMWACEYGHANVVDFLLERGTDVGTQPHGETGLHWASYAGHARVVKTLLKWNAPVNVRDKRFDGTPLGWALYGWCEGPSGANHSGYYEIVRRLVTAGATVDRDWLSEAKRGYPMQKRIRSDRRMLAALRSRESES